MNDRIDIPDSWRIPETATVPSLVPEAVPQLLFESRRDLNAHEAHEFVGLHLHRIGHVFAVATTYLPDIGEYSTDVQGFDGTIVVYSGYTVGSQGDGDGEQMLLRLLEHLHIVNDPVTVTGRFLYEAGERCWSRQGFSDRPLELRKIRGR